MLFVINAGVSRKSAYTNLATLWGPDVSHVSPWKQCRYKMWGKDEMAHALVWFVH